MKLGGNGEIHRHMSGHGSPHSPTALCGQSPLHTSSQRFYKQTARASATSWHVARVGHWLCQPLHSNFGRALLLVGGDFPVVYC